MIIKLERNINTIEIDKTFTLSLIIYLVNFELYSKNISGWKSGFSNNSFHLLFSPDYAMMRIKQTNFRQKIKIEKTIHLIQIIVWKIILLFLFFVFQVIFLDKAD